MGIFETYEGVNAYHPGYFIREVMERKEYTQHEFAERMGTTDKTFSDLINGKINLTHDLARKLASVLDMSVDFWLNIQAHYTEAIKEIEDRKTYNEKKDILQTIDRKYFEVHFGFKAKEPFFEWLRRLTAFLGIGSPLLLLNKDRGISYRKRTDAEKDPKAKLASTVWLLLCEKYAPRDLAPYDHTKLKESLPKIRVLTKEDPSSFIAKLKSILVSSGVSFVMLPYLKNSKMNGAVKWLGETPMIAINDNRKYADTFWFTLFHEIGHVLQGRKTKTFVAWQGSSLSMEDEKLENEADEFARDLLIPKKKYLWLLKEKRPFSREQIMKSAAEMDIEPTILIGRLQHDRYLKNESLTKSKRKYEFFAPDWTMPNQASETI